MKRFKLNLIDIIIIVLVVVIAVGGIIFFLSTSNDDLPEGEKVKISFDVEMTNLTKEVADSFKKEEVIIGTKETDTGMITNIDIQPHKVLVEDKENEVFKWSVVPEKYTAIVTIEKEVIETEKEFLSETEVYRLGIPKSFRGKGFAAWGGFIVRLDVISK